MPVRAGWVPCVGIQPPKPEVVYIDEAATCTQECEGVLGQRKPIAQGSEFLEMNDVQPKISKPAMKLVMNPKGVQDHTTVEQHYQQLLEQSNMSSSNMSPGVPASPEMVRDIITDMQSPTGKGAALFAKRKKRMDKFIVDETNVQKSSAYQQEQQSFVQNTTTEKSTVNQFSSFSSSTSSSSSSSTNQQKPGVLASSIPVSNKKKSLQARDEEQQRIMAEFLKNRESQFQIVKTPWEAVLETGNTSAAFKQNVQTKSSFSSTISAVSGPALPGGAAAPPPWLEMPQPVPVTAPLPKSTPSAPLPTPPSPFAAYTAGPAANEGVGGTGLVYTAEVKVVQPSGQPKSQVFQPSAAPSPFTPLAPVAKPAAPAASLSQPIFTAPAAAKPAPVFTKPVPSPGGLGGPLAQGAGFVSQAEAEERRKSMNFNLAANGWGNYNKYYRPISFAS